MNRVNRKIKRTKSKKYAKFFSNKLLKFKEKIPLNVNFKLKKVVIIFGIIIISLLISVTTVNWLSNISDSSRQSTMWTMIAASAIFLGLYTYKKEDENVKIRDLRNTSECLLHSVYENTKILKDSDTDFRNSLHTLTESPNIKEYINLITDKEKKSELKKNPDEKDKALINSYYEKASQLKFDFEKIDHNLISTSQTEKLYENIYRKLVEDEYNQKIIKKDIILINYNNEINRSINQYNDLLNKLTESLKSKTESLKSKIEELENILKHIN